MWIRATAIALVLAISGCYTTRMYNASQVPSAAVRSETTHTFVFGVVPSDPVNLENLCGEFGASEIVTQLAPSGALATFLTIGLWTPMKVTATCTLREH